jgi:hypothetical protein
MKIPQQFAPEIGLSSNDQTEAGDGMTSDPQAVLRVTRTKPRTKKSYDRLSLSYATKAATNGEPLSEMARRLIESSK